MSERFKKSRENPAMRPRLAEGMLGIAWAVGMVALLVAIVWRIVAAFT